MIVIDASVILKWYFTEQNSTKALELLGLPDGTLHGPDLLAIEVNATFVREANKDKARRDDAAAFIADFARKQTDGALTLQRPSPDGMAKAAALAIDLGHPLKDCAYLALAMDLACPLLTADARFAKRALAVYPQIEVLRN